MRVACVGYRNWAFNIYDNLAKSTEHIFLIFRSKSHFKLSVLNDFNPDIILFYGWSWKVPSYLLDKYICLMLHPSPLPRYRGGSPLQNQIIAGETTSMVSLFVMTSEMDAGDIVGQEDLDLTGSLEDIFSRIEVLGYEMTLDLLKNGFQRIPQDHSKASYCKRRIPADSEITLEELQTKPSQYLYNKIRMLADPYPNAYIRTSDGKRLMIGSAYIQDFE